MTERFNNWTDVANMKHQIELLEARVGFLKGKLDDIDKQEPAAYVPYGVFDAWLDQKWLGVRCLNPQLCDPNKVDVQAVYAYPKPLREPLVGTLLYLFQEWKEDHMSHSNYIDSIEAIKEAHGIGVKA